MPKDGVVVLHGIFRTHRSMAGFARALERSGFAVLNLGYPSTRVPLEALVEHIHPRIETFAQTVPGKLHFLGYSMGGLLIRAYLHQHRPQNLGRVVMVGTPNHGSEVADVLRNVKLYRWLYGPAGQQLVTDQRAMAHLFGPVDYELGVIAGNRPLDVISSRIIGQPNDGKVSVESTRIAGMKEHLILPFSHTFVPSNREVWRQACAFLHTGHFSRGLSA